MFPVSPVDTGMILHTSVVIGTVKFEASLMRLMLVSFR